MGLTIPVLLGQYGSDHSYLLFSMGPIIPILLGKYWFDHSYFSWLTGRKTPSYYTTSYCSFSIGSIISLKPRQPTISASPLLLDPLFLLLVAGPSAFRHRYTPQDYSNSLIQQRTRVPTGQISGYRCGFHKWLMCSVTLIPYPITPLTHNHRQEFLLSTGCWLVRQVGTRDKLRRCRHLHLNCIV